MQAANLRLVQSYGVMRIWISNTIHEPNPASPSAEPDADIGVTQKRFDFSLRIEGRLLPDSMSCIDVGDHSSAGLDKSYVGGNQRVGRSDPLADDKRLKLTEAFDSIQVIREFPKKDRGSDLTLGKWNRSPVPHDDGHEWLTFQGSAARRTNVLVELVPRHNAARFKLHPLLANILGMEEGTQQDVMSALWHYTENLRPEHDLDRRSVIFDDRLRKVSPNPLPDLGACADQRLVVWC